MFEFAGVAPPIITPFEKNGEIDKQALHELIDWWIEKKVHGIVPCGSNGEAVYMRFEERKRVIQATVNYVDRRVPVIAGTGLPSTRETIEMTQVAENSGADAALIVTPYYYPVTPEGIVDHYQAVADAVSLPVLLYNVPKFTHYSMSVQTVNQLSKLDNIIGVKESSGDFGLIQDIIRTTADANFKVYAGSGGLLAATLHAGGSGGILALANIAPEKCVEIVEDHQKGQVASAQELNYDLVDLNRAVTKRFGIPGLKCALKLRGLPAGFPRSPFQSANSTIKTELRALLKKVKLI